MTLGYSALKKEKLAKCDYPSPYICPSMWTLLAHAKKMALEGLQLEVGPQNSSKLYFHMFFLLLVEWFSFLLLLITWRIKFPCSISTNAQILEYFLEEIFSLVTGWERQSFLIISALHSTPQMNLPLSFYFFTFHPNIMNTYEYRKLILNETFVSCMNWIGWF